MPIIRHFSAWDYTRAIFLWVLLALSLGAYYRAVATLPVPSIEGSAAALLFRHSTPVLRPALEACYWMLLLPFAGLAWVRLLTVTAPYFGGANRDYAWSLVRFAAAAIPLILPLPYLVWMASIRGGFSLDRLQALALRRDWPLAPGWLFWLYLGLGVAALVWHGAVYLQVFGMRGRAAVRHLFLTLALYLFAATGAGVFLGYVINHWIAPWF